MIDITFIIYAAWLALSPQVVGDGIVSSGRIGNILANGPEDPEEPGEPDGSQTTNCETLSAQLWAESNLPNPAFDQSAEDTQLGDACTTFTLQEPSRQ